MSVYRKPLFWVLFALLSTLCTLFTFKFFPSAFPIVNLEVSCNRSQALQQAAKIAHEYNTGPQNYTQAAAFDVDDDVKTFVELEAGGKDALAQMLKDPYYAPYQWHVRHFKEFEKNETTFYLKPDGIPYGFHETLSENAPGAALTQEQALEIVQKEAPKWHINLSEYKHIEHSKETLPSGRVDHEITFEREKIRIGAGFYRVQFTISGDKLTRVHHYVKVPENFTRKYQEMRSANNSIHSATFLLMILLYVIGCCMIGLFLFVRKDWLIWKTPIIYAMIVAFLHVLVTINQMPIYWMHYKTELSTSVYILKIIVSSLYQFLYMAGLYGLAFLGAENLTRRAFGHQLQLWKVWQPAVASSYTMLGLTISGYLLIPLYFAFTILFYFLTTRFLGWWTPSGSFIDPNILANYFPWLSSIVRSLGAGFMEECLFRAVPLATAVLIGRRLGNVRLWLAIGLIVQALIFGAAHANYPSQPAYARIVELIFFSIIQGLIYLRFGLMPAIISHFAYDVVWMSLPIFVSSAPGSWINQTFIIILTLIPLLIVLFSRLKIGNWHEVSNNARNNAWQPLPQLNSSLSAFETIQELTTSLWKYTKPVLLASGALGLFAWFSTTQFTQDATPINVSMHQAKTIAQQTLDKHTIVLDSAWQPYTYFAGDYSITTDEELQHQWIWQKGNKELYKDFLGSYLKPPRWVVRYAAFSPKISLQDRAQEYHIVIAKDGKVIRVKHILPEMKSGPQLDESQARNIAHVALKHIYNLDGAQLKEISAQSEKKPDRKDWTFIFENKADYPLPVGQSRITISIAGDTVIDAFKLIHIPEEWERQQENKKNLLNILKFLSNLLMYLFFCMGIALLFKNGFALLDFRKALSLFFLLFCIFTINIMNGWPALIATLKTSEPYYNQIFTLLTTYGFGFLIKAAGFSLVLAGIRTWQKPIKVLQNSPIIYGICMGLIAAGLHAVALKFQPSIEPVWAEFDSVGNYLPWLGVITTTLIQYLTLTIAIIMLYVIVDFFTLYWQRNKFVAVLAMIACGICLNGIQSLESVPFWLIWGALIGMMLLAFYALIIRFDHAVVPIATATYMIMQAVQQIAFNAWPTAVVGYGLSIIMLIGLAWIWAKALNQPYPKD